ncbi:MAG: ABC transporter ATP-binding protein, partial [Actinomycetes bacterium]
APAVAELRLGGRDLTGLPAHRRGVGWVPQAGLLFPHLSALDNAAYGLREAGVSRRAAREAARGWLDRLGVGALADRRPGGLSGGEAQRVALARAFAGHPGLLLLDEPLAALDTATRSAVRSLLRHHLSSYDGICLFVTHDVVEAVALADRVLVLEQGRLVQDAPPDEVTRAPRSRWVAELFGWNAVTGTTTEHGLRLASGFELVAAEALGAGEEGLARIAPGAIVVHRTPPAGSARNVWPGRVLEVVPSGSRLRVRVRAVHGRPELVAEVTPAAAAELALVEGTDVWVSVKATEVWLAGL